MSRRSHKPQSKKDEHQFLSNAWTRFWEWVEEKDLYTLVVIFAASTLFGIGGTIFDKESDYTFFLLPLYFAIIIAIYLAIRKTANFLYGKMTEYQDRPSSRKKEKEQPEENSDFDTIKRSHRNNGIAGLVGLVMKADGIASRKELEVVANYLKQHYNSSDYEDILENLKINLKLNNTNFIKKACLWLKENMNEAERLGFAEFLFDIAKITHGIDKNEWELLSDIIKRIGLDEDDISYLSLKYAAFYTHSYSHGEENKHKNKQTNDHTGNTSTDTTRISSLRILGLNETASMDDIKAAYRKLAKKYHPDTVQDETMKQVLTEKFKEISLAYSFLTK